MKKSIILLFSLSLLILLSPATKDVSSTSSSNELAKNIYYQHADPIHPPVG
ncbi:hypothetical protein [Neobacillus niacini]|uniref:hypothetical protein n=1 Tax=Neobacillus niacini TaxID=86668 RepID=UPI000A6FF91E|nr:hypothetical protein [Neobacillus niacini]